MIVVMDADKERSPEERIQELETRVQLLEQQLARAAETVRELDWRLMTLANSTIADPRYPYWTWITTRGVPEDRRVRLEMLFVRMSDRVLGEPGQPAYVKDIEGVPSALLRESGPPPRDQVMAAIRKVAELMNDDQVVTLLRAVRDQGMFCEMCDYLLAPETLDPGILDPLR